MNVTTGLSIYNKPWLIEPNSAIQLLDFWEKVVAGEAKWDYATAIEQSQKQAYTSQQFFAKDKIAVAPQSAFAMDNFKGFNGASVAVIPISGPLMKDDYCGSLGTSTLKNLTQMAAQTDSVKTIMFAIDSPGGTVDGTQAFANVIKNAGKRTIAVVDGTMCSAAYWLGSQANEVYCTSATDVVGSIGTMASFVDRSKSMESKGTVLREYYATESTDKNRSFNEAIKGDGKKLISEHLDPINDVFLNTVRSARAGKLKGDENVFTGKTYLADKATEYGLVDGVKSFEDVLSYEVGRANSKTAIPNVVNIKTSNMNLEQLKAEHPDTFAAAVKSGVQQERDRVKSWLVFNDVDANAVKAGIESGEDLTKAAEVDLNRKSFAKNSLSVTASESAPVLPTPSTNTPAAKSDEQTEMDAILAACKSNLGLGGNGK